MPSFKWGHVYSFADGGYLANLQNGWGSGSRFSAGGGLRAGIGGLELGVEGAFPLKDARYETADKSPKINMILGYGF